MDTLPTTNSVEAHRIRLRHSLKTTRWLKRVALLLAVVIVVLVMFKLQV